MPHFVVVGHRARTAGDVRLDDLPGSGGRIDVLVRCVTAAFVRSHGLRTDVVCTLLLLGPPTPPRAVRFTGATLRHLNPDERTTAGLLVKALQTQVTAKVWQGSTPGIEVARRDLASVLDDALANGEKLVLLDENGEDVRGSPLAPTDVYVLGDHEGLTAEELALLDERGATRVRVGPVSLHADQTITVLHNERDRRL